jgi:hypothetical protein
MAQGIPQSATFAFDVAVRAVDEQLSRIDSLDSKAGILLAADGVLAGLIFVRGGVVARAPIGLGLIVSVTILFSLVCTLVSFADREYLARPRAETVAQLAAAPEDWIKWRLIGNVLRSVETNRARLRSKARWLTFGQAALLVTLLSLGSYFIYELLRDA